jgi:hypothetical protein
MTASGELYQAWYLGLAIAAAVVVLAAILLLRIIFLARRIAGLARTACEIVQQIDTNTRPIWSLITTYSVAEDLLAGARAIERNASAIAEAASHGSTGTA